MKANERIGKAAWQDLVGRVVADAIAAHEEAQAWAEKVRLEAEAVAALKGLLAVAIDLPLREPGGRVVIEARTQRAGSESPSRVALCVNRMQSWGAWLGTALLAIEVVARPDGRITYLIDGEPVHPETVYGAMAACVEHYFAVPDWRPGMTRPLATVHDLPESADDVIPF